MKANLTGLKKPEDPAASTTIPDPGRVSSCCLQKSSEH